MAKVGRPRKKKNEKVEYQLIAEHCKDYQTVLEKVEESSIKKVQVFHHMINTYTPKPKE